MFVCQWVGGKMGVGWIGGCRVSGWFGKFVQGGLVEGLLGVCWVHIGVAEWVGVGKVGG